MEIPIHEKTVFILRQGPSGYFRSYARNFDLPPLQLGDG